MPAQVNKVILIGQIWARSRRALVPETAAKCGQPAHRDLRDLERPHTGERREKPNGKLVAIFQEGLVRIRTSSTEKGSKVYIRKADCRRAMAGPVRSG